MNNKTENEILHEIYKNLLDGKQYGKQIDDVRYPYFSRAIFLMWSDHAQKFYFGCRHYGESAINCTLKELSWLLRVIFEMKPSEFVERYELR